MAAGDVMSAEARGRVAGVWDGIARQPLPLVALITAPEGTPEGFQAWAVGTPPAPRSIVLLPEISDYAPREVMDRYISRVVADATGTCPLCGQAAGLVGPDLPDPERPQRGRNAFYALPLSVGIRHDLGCPAIFTDADRRWFPSIEEA